jgi:hypothetical protein
MITINRNGMIVINVKANNFDKNCINNYYGNCNRELNYRSYLGNLIKEFDQSLGNSYESLEILIFRHTNSFHIIDKVINDYHEFLKDNIIFSFYIEPIKYHTNEKTYLFKS